MLAIFKHLCCSRRSRRPASRPRLEPLEDRCLLSNDSLIALTGALGAEFGFPPVRLGGIFVMRPDGTGIRQLTSFQTLGYDYEEHGLNLPDDHPAFSPDGTQIAFTSNRADADNWDLYVMNVNGSNVRRLTFSAGLDIEPVFSHDGTRIAWTSARAGNLNIFVMNVDGTGVRQLTTSSLEEIEPAWSPDDSQLAFTRVQGEDEKDVFIINADGTGLRQVTSTPGQDHDAVFTPDGEFLLISSNRAGTTAPFGDTFKIRVSDGGVVANLNHGRGGGDPNLSPDGSQFAFFQADFPVAAPPIHMWVGNSDGTGTPYELPSLGLLNLHPNWGVLADSDGDGRPDYLENANGFLTQDDVLSDPTEGDSFGTGIGLADLTHDGFPELIVGAPGSKQGTRDNAGEVFVVRGSEAGPLPFVGNVFIPARPTLDIDAADAGGAHVTDGHFGRTIATGDFNGDGFTDVAIGAPGQKQVFVSLGAGTAWRVLTSSDDNFGETLAAGDFNGDGIADLAVGAPTAVRAVGSTGAVSVYSGTPSGLIGAPQVFDGNNATLSANAGVGARLDDLFGFSLAAGDLNGDGVDDLAVGVPGKTVNGVVKAGLVHVIPGAAGLPLRLNQAVARDARSLPSPYAGLQTNARFGEALAAGDFDDDITGCNDLVVGVPRQDISGVSDVGLVAVFRGSSTGLLTITPTAFTTTDVGGGTSVTTSNFGHTFAVGDFGGDGILDLAVAADRRTVNGISEAGEVYLIPGSRRGVRRVGSSFTTVPGGLVPAAAQRIDSANVGAGRQTNGHFGSSFLFPSANTLAAGDIDGDAQDDLFIGEPQADVAGVADAGLVGIRYGIGVGTFALAPEVGEVDPSGRITLTLTWTHPENWHNLATIDVRLVGERGTVAWVRWDAAGNTFRLLDPESGRFGPAATPGSHVKWRTWAVTLELADTRVAGSGPDGKSVTLTLVLRLNPELGEGEYRVEVAATDDHGNGQDFEPAGVLDLRPHRRRRKPKGPGGHAH